MIWSRTATIAISPRLWVLPGIILGLANATQKNTITTSAARTASTSGFVTCHAPIVNNVWKSKSCCPGAGKPHPLKRWQPPAAAATSPVTHHLLTKSHELPSLFPVSADPAIAVDDPAKRDHESDSHADREKKRYVHGPPDEPADPAV